MLNTALGGVTAKPANYELRRHRRPRGTDGHKKWVPEILGICRIHRDIEQRCKL